MMFVIHLCSLQSYRIRTPPSTEKKSTWEKGTIDLDPKSDSSGQGDLLVSLKYLDQTYINSLTILTISLFARCLQIHQPP